MTSSTRGIDFANLSLKDALDFAVLVEEEAQERYDELTQQMESHDTHDAAAFFRFMAMNEAKHGRQLRERRERLFGSEPRAVDRTMLFDVEAADYDEVRAFMSPRRAMSTALRCEEKAHAFFSAAIPNIVNKAVRALFDELCAEELEHQRLVRREIEMLPPDADVDGDAFADEPVGH